MNLSLEDIAFFRTHGYLVVKNCISEDILSVAEKITCRWICELVEDWKNNGTLVTEQGPNHTSLENFLEIWKYGNQLENLYLEDGQTSI